VRSPDERSDIRGFSFASDPAYRCAHAGYSLKPMGEISVEKNSTIISPRNVPQRHCEEHLRRSNPFFLCCGMDCFAYARNDGFIA
jgi:hypothetical protein